MEKIALQPVRNLEGQASGTSPPCFEKAVGAWPAVGDGAQASTSTVEMLVIEKQARRHSLWATQQGVGRGGIDPAVQDHVAPSLVFEEELSWAERVLRHVDHVWAGRGHAERHVAPFKGKSAV